MNVKQFMVKYSELGGLITESMASELSNKSVSTIERWIKSGKVRSFRNKRPYVSYSDIIRILNENKHDN